MGAVKILNWNSDKNLNLIEQRGGSSEEVVFYVQSGGLLDDIVHPNVQTLPNQRIFVVAIEGYAHLVPYVEDEEQIFLKTIIASRKFAKMYLRGGK